MSKMNKVSEKGNVIEKNDLMFNISKKWTPESGIDISEQGSDVRNSLYMWIPSENQV